MTPIPWETMQAFSEALEMVHQETDLARLPERIFEVVERVLPDSLVTIDEFNTETKRFRHACNREAPEGWAARLQELVPQQHPAYFALLAGARESLRLRDLTTARAIRKTALHHEVFAPMKIHDQIALPLFIKDHVAGVTVNRPTPFTDVELGLCRLLAPHIALAHVHAQHFTRVRELEQQGFPAPPVLQALGLTAREAEVLHWVGMGRQDAEISATVGCKVRTVHEHVRAILRKLGVKTRTAAAHEARRRCGMAGGLSAEPGTR